MEQVAIKLPSGFVLWSWDDLYFVKWHEETVIFRHAFEKKIIFLDWLEPLPHCCKGGLCNAAECSEVACCCILLEMKFQQRHCLPHNDKTAVLQFTLGLTSAVRKIISLFAYYAYLFICFQNKVFINERNVLCMYVTWRAICLWDMATTQKHTRSAVQPHDLRTCT